MYICGKIKHIKVKKNTIFLLLDNGEYSQIVVKKRDKAFVSKLNIGDIVECSVVIDVDNNGRYKCKYPSYLLKEINIVSKNITNFNLNVSIDNVTYYFDKIFQIRKYLHTKGYIEVDVPILTNGEVSSRSKSFCTTYFDNGKEEVLYLRKTMDSFLRIYSCVGLNKVFAIGKCFRNESLTSYNKPEFEMLSIFTNYLSKTDAVKLSVDLVALITFKDIEVQYVEERKYKEIKPLNNILYVITGFDNLINTYCALDKYGKSNEFKIKYKNVTIVHGIDEICDIDEYNRKIEEQKRNDDYGELKVLENLIGSGAPKCFNIGISVARIISLYNDKKISDYSVLSFDRIKKWRNIWKNI